MMKMLTSVSKNANSARSRGVCADRERMTLLVLCHIPMDNLRCALYHTPCFRIFDRPRSIRPVSENKEGMLGTVLGIVLKEFRDRTRSIDRWRVEGEAVFPLRSRERGRKLKAIQSGGHFIDCCEESDGSIGGLYSDTHCVDVSPP